MVVKLILLCIGVYLLIMFMVTMGIVCILRKIDKTRKRRRSLRSFNVEGKMAHFSCCICNDRDEMIAVDQESTSTANNIAGIY